MRDCHYIISPIGYWGKSSTVCWYQVLRFLLLVTTCFDNNGFLGVVTLNSLCGILPQWFSLFINKSPKLNLFSVAFNIVGDCLCYHAYCMKLNLINFTWLINLIKPAKGPIHSWLIKLYQSGHTLIMINLYYVIH